MITKNSKDLIIEKIGYIDNRIDDLSKEVSRLYREIAFIEDRRKSLINQRKELTKDTV